MIAILIISIIALVVISCNSAYGLRTDRQYRAYLSQLKRQNEILLEILHRLASDEPQQKP